MAASPTINKLTEAVNDALGGFHPERLMPDVNDFFAGMPEVFGAWREQVQKVAGRLEDDSPVHGDVTDAMREMIPHLDRLQEAAEEAWRIFQSSHENDRKRYNEPRTNEPQANV